MTKEDFIKLQVEHLNSKLSLKIYLAEKGIAEPQYYYWKKKFENNPREFFDQFIDVTSKIKSNPESVEVVLQYPNGIKIIFNNYPGSNVRYHKEFQDGVFGFSKIRFMKGSKFMFKDIY